MELLNLIWTNGASFLFILTVIVFFHELGHFALARYHGVRVEMFSVGFGPELFGWTAKSGTRWKVCLLPLGGYVKMFGETASGAEDEDEKDLTPAEKEVSFHCKRVGQRAAIVAAGPIANFVLAILILTVMFSTIGQPYTPADIGKVQVGGVAEAAGLKAGDKISSIDGQAIERFEDVQRVVRMAPDKKLSMVINRAGKEITVLIVPKRRQLVDRFGNKSEIGLIGISRAGTKSVRHGVFQSAWRAVGETWRISTFTMDAVGQIVMGQRSAEDLGGPIRIAQMSGQVAELGLTSVFWFLAVLSINLGLINLFPIPMLDGGHLIFYGIEAVRGSPVSDRIMEYGFRFGLAMILALFVFVTYQDLSRFKVLTNFVEGLFS
ncbi:MAG: RIP metalloprotease RseP [Rhodospirillales bacterium]|jgi:regulator of sigma E protease|nr:RIP metalloprotease RseP [Rhodospirillales bacterium]MBT4005988.1 RIP metalloprotease RseP [Rhodospirillales bacterium]MBT5075719.1 RIP metalloprotease RseP [Rhodospirillales bacterium]MBT5112731.1 RIP metalloprotease RseP [Rhodospirillales bacterium]MBT5673501.1 RIP metalloprotease RseP [Rhodospirillales bacterium]